VQKSTNCCHSLNAKEKTALLAVMGDEDKKGFYVSMPLSCLDKRSQDKVEKLIPSSDAKVFRTSTGFVVRDVHDPDWCKYIPFDDLDRIQTKVAYKTLNQSQIEAMESMPLPSMVPVPREVLQDMEVEFENICRQEKERANLESEDFVPDYIIDALEAYEPESRLSMDDLVQNQFGTLAPYISDYVNDEFEVEEDSDAHLPSLSQFGSADEYYGAASEISPLSYQKTVFNENPYISEDFDEKTESLICSALSEFDQDENEFLPSSVELSRYEQELFIKKQDKPKEAVETQDESLEEDLDPWALVRKHVTPDLVFRGIFTVITLLLIVFIEIPVIVTCVASSALSHFGKTVMVDLKNMGYDLLSYYFSSKRARKKNRWKRAIIHQMSLPHGLVPPDQMKVKPLQNVSFTKPEGSVASSGKVRRTYRIEPVKISEARIIKLNDSRPYVMAKFFDETVRYALLDSGATCSAIHPRFLAKLQEQSFVPTAETKIKVEGCIPGVKKTSDTIAYLTFQLESGHWINHAPFIVHSGNYDLMIGSNLIRGYRWSCCWKNQNCYIDLGNNQPMVPLHYADQYSYETTAASVDEITIQPQESVALELDIPQLGSRLKSPLKGQDLFVESLAGPDKEGLNIVPSLTRINKHGSLFATVLNKSSHPYKVAQGQLLATVTSVPKCEVGYIDKLLETRQIFNMIPRLVTTECHCDQTKHVEQNETVVQIIITNKWGMGVTGCILDPLQPCELEPGFHLMYLNPLSKKGTRNNKFNLILVTDDDGGLGHITQKEIIKVKNKIQGLLKQDNLQPLFYLIDPLIEISFTTRQVLVDLWQEIPFSIFPARILNGHEQCVRPSLNMNHDDFLVGIDSTTVHFQIGPAPPPVNMLQKDGGSIEKEISFKGASLFMFRDHNKLNCHFHMPLLDQKKQILTEAARNFYARWVFNELRSLRIPHRVQITADGFSAANGAKISNKYYITQLVEVLRDMLLFPEPSARVFWPLRMNEGCPDVTNPIKRNCTCSMCRDQDTIFNPGVVILYDGSINDLITKINDTGSNISEISSCSRLTGDVKAVIDSICDTDDGFDTDVPLDPLELCPEEEMTSFLTTLPGQEQVNEIDEMDTSDLPPIQKSDPKLFGDYPMEGIPDHFRPGDWRNTDIMDRIPPEVPQYIKDKFGELLDKHSNLFSYYPDNSRPLSLHGRPVVLDVELTTDIPVFMKPYTCFGSQIDMLDDKLTELLEKNEIHDIDSKYNIAVILTHHNSSQKHVQGTQKKVRLCLDMRVINMLTKGKNLDSHFVTGIEQKKTVLKGHDVLSSHDFQKAYRAVLASPFLQQITAFRCPSSRKYPNRILAFKSAPDGTACMPGLYSKVVNEALSPEARKNSIFHIDDILVYSKTYEEHLEHLDIVYTDLGRCNFLLSASKLKPFQKEICFLGFMISGQEQWIPEDRKSYVDGLEPPKTKKQLQALLGTANYLSAFIDGFQHCCGPLYDAMKGKSDKITFQLNDIQMKAFHEIKRLIKEAPRLGHLDTSQPIYLECDASLVGAGNILYQIYDLPDGTKKKVVIRYGSKRWSTTESLNHTSLEREALAILVAVRQHMIFLQACPEVIIKTDLKSLIPILSCYNNPDSTTMALTSHKLYSLPFRWKLHHIPGANLPVADFFSRIYKPYECQFTDRRFRYPDLKREHIEMPDEWKNNPDLILTTADLMEAMRQQIMFIEKSSYGVKEKRLKSFLNEITLLYEGLGPDVEELLTKTKNDLYEVQGALKSKAAKKKEKAEIQEIKLTVPAHKSLITPEFLMKGQQSNPKLYNIIMTLRTKTSTDVPKQMLKNYRILNDSFLVTRTDKTKPFDHPGNIRIVCDSKMTIQILSILHVMNCHYGQNLLNHVFQQTYKCIEGSTQGYVKLVCTGCRSCQFVRVTNKKLIPHGRIPYPPGPNQTWCVDFMDFKEGQTYNGKKVVSCFNIMDLYSGFLISYLVKDHTSKTVIDCFKRMFALFNSPVRILSDNATSICKSPEVIHFLRSNNVKQLVTITSHNSRANKVERLHKLFRETLMLVKETFKRPSQFELFHNVVRMLNNRQLTLALHPNVKQICKDLDTKPGIVTPFSLQFGLPPEQFSSVSLEDRLDEDSRVAFKAKWQQILSTHDKMLQSELEERQASFNGSDIQVGDLVLISNEVRHKEQVRYYKEIFEVIRIEKAKYYCAPLFKTTGIKSQLFEVNGNRIKKYNYSALFDVLPAKVRVLMGENLSPEQLKAQAECGSKIPADLHDWRQWRPNNVIKLRNRITPPDRVSEPAMSIINTDTLSSSSSLSIPDSIPDSMSVVSSILTKNERTFNLKTTHDSIIPVSNCLPDRRINRVPKKQLPLMNAVHQNKRPKPSFDNISPIKNPKVVLPSLIKENAQKSITPAELSDKSTLGAETLVNNMVRELVDQVQQPVNDFLTKTPKLTAKEKVLDVTRRLRDRAKILKPLKYRDANFTKKLFGFHVGCDSVTLFINLAYLSSRVKILSNTVRTKKSIDAIILLITLTT